VYKDGVRQTVNLFCARLCHSCAPVMLAYRRQKTNNYSASAEYAGHIIDVKGYAERVEVYADGRLIAAHARCFGKHQAVYKLEHHMLLLERRGRAILNAAPVLQNVPEDVLEQLRANACDATEQIRILRRCCESQGPKASAVADVGLVQPVDLRR